MKLWLAPGDFIDGKVCIEDCEAASRDWQLFRTTRHSWVLLVSDGLVEYWKSSGFLELSQPFKQYKEKWIFVGKKGSLIASVKEGPYPYEMGQIVTFCHSVRIAMNEHPHANFQNALYLEEYNLLLPCDDDDEAWNAKVMVGTWISGGVTISVDSFDRLYALTNWTHRDALKNAINLVFAPNQRKPDELSNSSNRQVELEKSSDEKAREKTPFSLPGRPALEKFFREQIIDIIEKESLYERMGIGFPGSTILQGPPGCGKTYAVEKLVDYLGWPYFPVNSGTIGSPYIHDTGRKITEIFDKAIQNAPSVVVIDEMEAFLSDRKDDAFGMYHVEEVAEFLRRIPDAVKHHVLIFGMTNMISKIDPAILRRGRFDHIIEVGMPSAEECQSLLASMFSTIPHTNELDIAGFSKTLEGHPISDIAYVVREAGRLTVVAGKTEIDNETLQKAIVLIDSREEQETHHRKIGFGVSDDGI